MKTRTIFMIASAGILAGIISIFAYSTTLKPREPISVSYNPYESGLYATGMVESFQTNGTNLNLYPAVEGPVTEIFVQDGQRVKKGDPLLNIESSTQAGTAAQSKAAAQAQKANLVNLQEQYSKYLKAYHLNKKAVSQNTLDNAKNAVLMAEKDWLAAKGQAQADQATLNKCFVVSPVEGIIFRVVPTIGDYVSPVVGAYDPSTQATLPMIQIGSESDYLQVRVYVDEILTPLLPEPDKLEAQLFVRGLKNVSIPLAYVNMQPYTIPNIQLSDQTNERVDVRVLPIIFKFERPKDMSIFPGQLVDVYIKGKP